MKSVVIGGISLGDFACAGGVKTIEIEGMPVTVGWVETPDVAFDPKAAENKSSVLIEVSAFSCNYRDKALILVLSRDCRGASFQFTGSDFTGKVIAAGEGVTSLQENDRVIGNNHYPDSGVQGVPPGIPSNCSSQRFRVLHERQLVKVPPEVPEDAAAAFSIGAQTAYGIVRRLELAREANVLLTSAKSNTSLFVLNALKKCDVHVYATSTSRRFEAELRALGLEELFEIVPNTEALLENQAIKAFAMRTGGFDNVIDPFFDLHLGDLVDVMKFGAKYITCGLYDQYSSITGRKFQHGGKDLKGIMSTAIFRNLHLMGNCLGQTQDLVNALHDQATGKFPVVIDSVFSGGQVAEFFERTYNSRDRFGKVVYRYDS